MRRKLIALVLVTTLFVNMGVVSYANEVKNDTVNEMVHKKAVELLEKGYGEYYNLYDSKASLCCKHESNNMIEEHFLLEIDVMLKAGSVQELDYYQGIMDYKTDRLAVLNKASLNSISTDLINNTEYFSLLSNQVRSIYDNCNQYINKVQKMNFYVKATYEKENYDSITIMYENGMDYVTAEEIYPPSHNELKQNGYSHLASLDNRMMKKIENSIELGETLLSSFSLVQAIGYSGRYSSNPTSCNVCGSGCGAYVNTEVYNSSYKHYVEKDKDGNMHHADCANFVSQILYAGGIPTSSIWKADTGSWIGVSKLTDYMVDNGYWESISSSEVFVGDILVYIDAEDDRPTHVVMITAHDGVSFRYTGHTNDRLNVTTSLSSSDDYYTITY